MCRVALSGRGDCPRLAIRNQSQTMLAQPALKIRHAMSAALGLALLALLPVSAAAQDAWKCTHPDGRIEYTNRSNVDARICTRLNIEPATVVPAPAPRPAAPVAAPPRPATPATSAGPTGFPRIDGATQRARDSDRKRILEEELATQEARLAELTKVYNNGQPERLGDETRNYQKYLDRVEKLKSDLARVQGDIASVKSELAKIQ